MSLVLVFLRLAEIYQYSQYEGNLVQIFIEIWGIYVILTSLCTSVCIVKYILSFFFFLKITLHIIILKKTCKTKLKKLLLK